MGAQSDVCCDLGFFELCRRHGDSPSLLFILYSLFFVLLSQTAELVYHKRLDPTKIKNDLGWYPETPFEKGIVLTIDWYLNHEEWMNHVTSGDYQNYYQDMYKNK